MYNIENLPDEVLLKIFGYLCVLENGNCQRISKRIRKICLDKSLKYLEIRNSIHIKGSHFVQTFKKLLRNERFENWSYLIMEDLEQLKTWQKEIKASTRTHVIYKL